MLHNNAKTVLARGSVTRKNATKEVPTNDTLGYCTGKTIKKEQPLASWPLGHSGTQIHAGTARGGGLSWKCGENSDSLPKQIAVVLGDPHVFLFHAQHSSEN